VPSCRSVVTFHPHLNPLPGRERRNLARPLSLQGRGGVRVTAGRGLASSPERRGASPGNNSTRKPPMLARLA